MKKQILIIMILAAIAGVMNVGCNTPTQKVEKAKDNVDQAKDDLDQANLEYLVEVERFKNETKAKTVTNEQMIAELKARIAQEKNEVRVLYEKKIAELEKKNSELSKSIDNYKDEGKDKWVLFKDEFNSDMDKLGMALKDFFRDNQK